MSTRNSISIFKLAHSLILLCINMKGCSDIHNPNDVPTCFSSCAVMISTGLLKHAAVATYRSVWDKVLVAISTLCQSAMSAGVSSGSWWTWHRTASCAWVTMSERSARFICYPNELLVMKSFHHINFQTEQKIQKQSNLHKLAKPCQFLIMYNYRE